MHRAAYYLSAKFPAGVKRAAVESYVLTPGDAAAVKAALPLDANDYYYSACMSAIDGLRAIDVGFYTWSTVKMYYTVFYALRAILAWDNYAVFRPVKAPFCVAAHPGALPVWIPGEGSHKSMLNCFRTLKPNHDLLSQDIDLKDGLEWLQDKRETANYFLPRFCEPDVPDYFLQIVRLGVRKALVAYLDRSTNLLTFDKDHSIVSFPIAALKIAGGMATANGGAETSNDELAFLQDKCKQRNGALAPLMTFIASTLKR